MKLQPKKLSKKEKKEQRRLKKLAKYQEDSPAPDWDAPEDSLPPQQQSKGNKKGKGKKNKKGGKGRKQQQQQSSDVESDDADQHKGGKKGKKGKQKQEESSHAEKLVALKEQRQQDLLQLANSLVADLDIKFAPHFDGEVKELWEAQVLEFVEFYDEEDADVEDDVVYELKMEELRAAWSDVSELIEQDYADAQEASEEAQPQIDDESDEEQAQPPKKAKGKGKNKKSNGKQEDLDASGDDAESAAAPVKSECSPLNLKLHTT